MLSSNMLKNTWQRLPPDARESVTYFSKGAAALPGSGQTVKNAHRKPLTKEQIGEDQQLAKLGVSWDLWASQMTGVTWGTDIETPKVGDVFNDSSGNRYYVNRVEFLDLRQRYNLTCLQTPPRA